MAKENVREQWNVGELAIEELQDVSAGDMALVDTTITVWGGRLNIEYEYNRAVGAVLPVYTFVPQR